MSSKVDSMIDLLEDLIERADGIGPTPWVVTSRSSPGWRIEDTDGTLIGYGPGDVLLANHANWLVDARNQLGSVYDQVLTTNKKVNEVVSGMTTLDVENQDLYNDNQELRDLLSDVHEYLVDYDMPDWYVSKVEEVLT